MKHKDSELMTLDDIIQELIEYKDKLPPSCIAGIRCVTIERDEDGKIVSSFWR